MLATKLLGIGKTAKNRFFGTSSFSLFLNTIEDNEQMNTIDKNRQFRFGKVLGAFFGCAVLFTGLALPAYGQVDEQDGDCGNDNRAGELSGGVR
ncbi:hypothetical protein [Candidatus Spongiihabitans sp.]|uniref:hypothetical protein n=1 Tax=Candidatus Spongiihabitans sp. TaxID=3101308 RepID=UPI003C7035F4